MEAAAREASDVISAVDVARGVRVRSGDSRAFEEIVDEFQVPLVRYLRRMTRCEDRARDLAQEAFVRLYANRQRYREEGLIGAYLYRIATNLLRSEERRKTRWRLLEPRYRNDAGTAEVEATDRAAQRTESNQQVRDAIAELPTRFRAPLVLREIEGLPYDEIARLLGCRVGTAKSRVNRAKQRLRDQLSEYWLGGSEQ